MDTSRLHAEVTITCGPPQSPPRPHSDEELTAALAPFAADYLARMAEDRPQHGSDYARMAACGRLAHYYALVFAACHDGTFAATVRGGAP